MLVEVLDAGAGSRPKSGMTELTNIGLVLIGLVLVELPLLEPSLRA